MSDDVHWGARPDKPGVDDPGAGRRLGLDVGTVRIGVAVSDSMAMLATPVETIARVTEIGGQPGADVARIVELVEDYRIVEIVVGLPRNLKNHGSASVSHAVFIAEKLREVLGAHPVIRFADERLTTVSAQRALRECGVREKKGRGVIDQAAAVEILQQWLDGRSRAVGF